MNQTIKSAIRKLLAHCLGGLWWEPQVTLPMRCKYFGLMLSALLGYALSCCYCCMHMVVISHCTVDTVACMYMGVNSTSRVHGIWVHMWWHMWGHMSIVAFMQLRGSYLKSPVSWITCCTWMYVCVKVQLDIHRALCSLALMSGYFPPGWLYDIPVMIYVHVWAYDNRITTLGSWFEVQKLGLLSIS